MGNSIQEVKSFFSGGQALEDMKQYTGNTLKLWELEVITRFPPEARVLDIGCGMGREACALHAEGFHVTGIDISEPAIDAARAIARGQGLSVEFLLADGVNLPCDDGAFDVVIIWAQTFGLYYGAQAQQRILRECRRALTDGGLLSFSGHDREYLQAHHAAVLRGDRLYPYADTDVYWETFTPGQLSDQASAAGFRVLSCERGMVYTPEDGTVLHCLCD